MRIIIDTDLERIIVPYSFFNKIDAMKKKRCGNCIKKWVVIKRLQIKCAEAPIRFPNTYMHTKPQ